MNKRLAGVICAVLLSGCAPRTDWAAFVFPGESEMPDASEAENYIIGKFASFEQCQEAAIKRVKVIEETSMNFAERFDDFENFAKTAAYECGFKCTHRKNFGGLLVCKETRK